MRRLIAILVAATALAVAGCGADDADSSGGNPDQNSSSDPAGSSRVESVAMTRTGGVAGVRESWRIGPSDRGHAAVFEAASQEQLADVEGAKGKPPCCDFFQYSLVIRYADGSTASYRTYDGGTSDPALDQLVSAVLKTAPVPSASPDMR